MPRQGFRLVADRESSLPRAIAQLDILQVERREQRVEAAELEKAASIDHRGAAAGEHRRPDALTWALCHVRVVYANEPPPESAKLTGSGFRAGVEVEHSAVDREEQARRIPPCESAGQRRNRGRVERDVVVEKKDERMFRCRHAAVARRAEANIRLERHNANRDLPRSRSPGHPRD